MQGQPVLYREHRGCLKYTAREKEKHKRNFKMIKAPYFGKFSYWKKLKLFHQWLDEKVKIKTTYNRINDLTANLVSLVIKIYKLPVKN